MKITLSTGREIFANEGIIGINIVGEVSHGLDGGIYEAGLAYDPEWDHWTPFTDDERRELADMMISRWQAYRQSAGAQEPTEAFLRHLRAAEEAQYHS